MIDVLIAGRLLRDSRRRTGQSGKAFTTAMISAAVEGADDRQLVSVIAFGDQAERDRLAALIGQQAGIDLSARESELAELKRQYGDILADEAAGTQVDAEYLTALVERIDQLEAEISDARKTAERDRIRNEGLTRKLAAADDKLAAVEAEFRETFRCFLALQEQAAQLDYVKAANDLIDAYARFMQISRIQSQSRHQTTPIYGFLSLPGFNGRPLIDKAALLKLPIDPEPLLAHWRAKGLKT